jgi:hypothetical protein
MIGWNNAVCITNINISFQKSSFFLTMKLLVRFRQNLACFRTLIGHAHMCCLN